MLGLNPAMLVHITEPRFLVEHPWLDIITKFYVQELQTELHHGGTRSRGNRSDLKRPFFEATLFFDYEGLNERIGMIRL